MIYNNIMKYNDNIMTVSDSHIRQELFLMDQQKPAFVQLQRRYRTLDENIIGYYTTLGLGPEMSTLVIIPNLTSAREKEHPPKVDWKKM